MEKRDPLALAMLAAWVNAPADKLPDTMRAHTCDATMDAWGRVAEAARGHLSAEVALSGLEDWLRKQADLAGMALSDPPRPTAARAAFLRAADAISAVIAIEVHDE